MKTQETINRGEPRGRVALVTGASRGVGAAIAKSLAANGVDVVVSYRSKQRRADEVVDAVQALGRNALAVEADLTDPSATAAMYSVVRDRFGRLDLLVLNASGGLERDAPVDYAMQLNLTAQVRALEMALPLMSKGSRVLFVTSHLAHFYGTKPVYPSYEPIAASKKAGEDALRTYIPELAERGVSLVVVSGDIIEGTVTPKMLDRQNPGLLAARRDQAGSLPTIDSFAQEIVAAAVDESLPSGTTVYVGSTDWTIE